MFVYGDIQIFNKEKNKRSMKKKFSKILGVGLTLSLLISLLLTAAPVSADISQPDVILGDEEIRSIIQQALEDSTSSKRSKRGIMSVAKFKAIGHLAWTREDGVEDGELWTNQTRD